MNVLAVSADLDANVYVLGPVRSAVDGHGLPLYAVTADEQQFFANNNVSTVYEPLLVPQDSGYHSGNLLIGQLKYCIYNGFVASIAMSDKLDQSRIGKRMSLQVAGTYVYIS